MALPRRLGQGVRRRPPASMKKPEVKGRFIRQRLIDPRRCDRRSFRDIAAKGEAGKQGIRIIICCPTGHWDPKRKRCTTGTEAQELRFPTSKFRIRGRKVEMKGTT